ncbi:hypothetical protein [Microtetraspora glauca]|uniref:Uncharacterized protein n=1 Tax=Microtetraspora glauca TaxID=1996 RepID=A0ABV3GAX8_MICGL
MPELPPAVAKYVADADPFVRGTNKAVAEAKRFQNSADKAALAARKMGVEARQAGEKAAIAGKVAAEAAEKAAKGLIKEAEAARLAANAVEKLERAELKQIAAAIAMREASEKAIKAHGAHQSALKSLAKDGERAGGMLARAMQSAGNAATGALDSVGTSGVGMAAVVAAGIGLLPVAGVAAATVITGVLGGSLVGLGLLASKGSKEAQAAIGHLKTVAKSEARQIGQPFEHVWVTIGKVAERELKRLRPMLRNNLAELAPEVESFVDLAGASLGRLEPAVTGAQRAFSAMLRSLGPQMPSIMDSLARAITNVTDAVEENPETITAMVQGLATLVEWAGKAVGDLVRLAGTIRENADAFQAVFSTLVPMTGVLHELGLGVNETGVRMGEVTTITTNLGTAQRGAATAANAQKSAQQQLNSAMSNGATTADQLKAAIDRLTKAHQDADSAEIAFKQAIADATKGVKEHGKGLDLNTQKGRDNKRALIEVAQAAQAKIEAMRADNRSMQAVNKASGAARKEFINLAMSMGYSEGKAKALANRLLGIKSRKVKVEVNTSQATGALSRFLGMLGSVPSFKTVSVGVMGGYSPIGGKRADGGPVVGPGGPRDDQVLIAASNGEFVVNAASTAKHRGLIEAINADRYADGGLVGYASGGQVRVGGVSVSASQWRSLGQQLGKDFLKVMSDGSAKEIASLSSRLEKAIAKLFGGKRTTLDNKLIAYLDKNSAKLEKLATQRDAATKALAEAKEYATSVTGNARSFAGLTSLDGPMDAGGIRTGLTQKVGRLKAYAKAIQQLSSRGLSKSLLRQVIDAGPEQGLELAQMLLSADRSTFAGINKAQAEIDSVSKSLGRSSADILYDAGKKAGDGFLTGLQASLKSLDKEMDALAKKMAKSIKKALKIKSPSQLPAIRESGAMTVAGVAAGMADNLGALDRSSALMAARLSRPRVRPAIAPLIAHGGGTTAAGSAEAPTVLVQVTLDGRELRAGVQSETLRYQRRNGGSNGLNKRT